MSLDILPAIDMRHGRCVRLQQGDYDRETVYSGSPVEVARQWEAAGAPWIHLVDLDGARSGQPENLGLVRHICETVGCPCELGGGIRNPASIEEVLRAGVRRVILGTVVAENPSYAQALLEDFTAEELVAGLDARDGRVVIRGWEEESTVEAVDLAVKLHDHGIRQFIYTDVVTDGMFTGPNLTELQRICDAVPNASVIASGGVGNVDHVRSLVELARPNLVGVIVGKALYDGRVSYEELVAAAND